MASTKFTKPTTPEEEEVLVNEFRQLLTPGGSTLVDEQLKKGGEPNGLDILTLRRWLVARKWDLVAAVRDLSAHALYRSEQVPSGRVPQELAQVDLDQNKTFVNGYDNQHNPFIVLLCKRHMPHSAELSRRAIEYTLDAAVGLGSLNPGWGGKLSIVFDLAGISYANFDTASLKAVFDLLQNHYPERLAKLFLYRAPMIFYALWALVKPFIDPVTRTKVVFIEEKEAAVVFVQYFNLEVFPKQLGGKGPLRCASDVWTQLDGDKFLHPTTLHSVPAEGVVENKPVAEEKLDMAPAGITLTATGDVAIA